MLHFVGLARRHVDHLRDTLVPSALNSEASVALGLFVTAWEQLHTRAAA